MLNEKRQIWKCPRCNKEAPFSSVYVDSYFTEVLKSTKNDNINEIEFLKNGKWKPFEPKTNNTIMVLDSDDESTEDTSTRKDQTPTLSSVTDKLSINKQVIVPSMDPRLKNGKRRETANVRKQTSPSQSSSRARNMSPEVITLGDSSDEENQDDAVMIIDSPEPRNNASEISQTTSSLEQCKDRIEQLCAVMPTQSPTFDKHIEEIRPVEVQEQPIEESIPETTEKDPELIEEPIVEVLETDLEPIKEPVVEVPEEDLEESVLETSENDDQPVEKPTSEALIDLITLEEDLSNSISPETGSDCRKTQDEYSIVDARLISVDTIQGNLSL